MAIQDICAISVSGKSVLVRVDFNVELDEQRDVKEKYKVLAAKETVDYLVAQGAKVALLTHLGRPEGKLLDEFSVRHIVDDAERILGRSILFVDDCIGEKVAFALSDLPEGGVLLLENVRFHAGDEINDVEFSRALASSFDMFVNDAFSVCHRDQASVTGVTKFLPSFAGKHLMEEIRHLTAVRDCPARPAIAIIGGAKIETKLPILRVFEKSYDKVLVGSKIACEANEQKLTFSEKVVFPEDYTDHCLDIGVLATEQFCREIADAKTIIWNGPLGKFESPEHAKGTYTILDAIVKSDAFSVVGGGETIIALEEAGMFGKISFVSTGGGAMLEFLSGEPMPGFLALEKEK